jgi:hypothetical protein
MTKIRKTLHPLSIAIGVAVMAFSPAPCRAATAALPWDQPLIVLQDILIGTVAPAAIGLAFSAAAILYTLGGCDKRSGRLIGSGIGGCVALVIVHMLNYVLA